MKQLMYRAPGRHKRHGVMVEIAKVPHDDIAEYEAERWRFTPMDAEELRLRIAVLTDTEISASEQPAKRPRGRPRKTLEQ